MSNHTHFRFVQLCIIYIRISKSSKNQTADGQKHF